MAAAIISMPAVAPAFAAPEPEETPAAIEQTVGEIDEPYEQSVQIKPSSGEIEKNSFQEPYDKSDLKNEVVPKSESEIFRILVKFLQVMAAVLLSASVIYLLLLFYKKHYYKDEMDRYHDSAPKTENGTPEAGGDLKSPQDENEALKNFLNQTKNR